MTSHHPWIPVVLALAVCGCGGGGSAGDREAGRAPDEDTPARGGQLVVAYISDASFLNPIVEQNVTDQYIINNVFPELTDSRFDCDVVYEPGLAESWELSPDKKSLTFQLKQGVTWEDGVEVTAEDVVFSYQCYGDPATTSPRLGYVNRMVPDNPVESVDRYTARFNFVAPYFPPTQLAHAGLTIVPKHLLENAPRSTFRSHAFSQQPVGVGPWRVQHWKKNQEIVLVPWEKDNLQPRPYLDRVVFRIIPEYVTRLQELKNGSIDLMDTLNVPDADVLARDYPHVTLHRRGWRFVDYIAWNLQHELFADKRVRHALTMAINRDELIEALLVSQTTGERYGRPAVGTISPELCDWHNDAIEPLPFDPDQAKHLLAEAGWSDSNGDGWLDKDGQRFAFELATNAGNKRREQATVIVQEQLKQVGVEAKIEYVETSTFYENARKKNFVAMLAGWSAALLIDPTNVWHSDTPERRYEFNFVSYANPEVDALIDGALSALDPADAQRQILAMQAKIYEDQPYTFLYWRDEIVGVSSRFRDVKIDIGSLLNDLHTWWVPERLQKYKTRAEL